MDAKQRRDTRHGMPVGKTRKVRLELTKAGRKKLSSSKRAKAKATITDKRTGKSKSFRWC